MNSYFNSIFPTHCFSLLVATVSSEVPTVEHVPGSSHVTSLVTLCLLRAGAQASSRSSPNSQTLTGLLHKGSTSPLPHHHQTFPGCPLELSLPSVNSPVHPHSIYVYFLPCRNPGCLGNSYCPAAISRFPSHTHFMVLRITKVTEMSSRHRHAASRPLSLLLPTRQVPLRCLLPGYAHDFSLGYLSWSRQNSVRTFRYPSFFLSSS